MISRRLLQVMVVVAGTLLLAGAAQAACLGPRGNWVACPPGTPANATITGLTFHPSPPDKDATTDVRFNAPPFLVNVPGFFSLTAAGPDTANAYAALKFLDYGFRMPDGDLPPGRAWPRFDEFAQKGPLHEIFEKPFDVRAVLIAPPPAIRRADALTAGVPQLLLPGGTSGPAGR